MTTLQELSDRLLATTFKNGTDYCWKKCMTTKKHNSSTLTDVENNCFQSCIDFFLETHDNAEVLTDWNKIFRWKK